MLRQSDHPPGQILRMNALQIGAAVNDVSHIGNADDVLRLADLGQVVGDQVPFVEQVARRHENADQIGQSARLVVIS